MASVLRVSSLKTEAALLSSLSPLLEDLRWVLLPWQVFLGDVQLWWAMEKAAKLIAPPKDWKRALGFRKKTDILVPILSLTDGLDAPDEGS